MSNTVIKTLKPHISLNVRNVEESVNFYRKMLGIEPMKFIKADTEVHSVLQAQTGLDSRQTRTGYAKFDVQNPPLNLVLNEIEFKEGGSLSHLGLQVATTEDVLAMREIWHKNDLPTVDEMAVNCCYAIQDKAWVSDPDGNEWEVFVVLENTENQQDSNPTSFCCVTADKQTNSSCAPITKTVSISR